MNHKNLSKKITKNLMSEPTGQRRPREGCPGTHGAEATSKYGDEQINVWAFLHN